MKTWIARRERLVPLLAAIGLVAGLTTTGVVLASGGRKLTDDVVDLGLTAIFSSFLSAANTYCAPFTLPLCTDNVGANDVAFSPSFPYLASAH